MPAHAIIVMGVSGSGKSTIGQHLAARLPAAFLEGDTLHPAPNIAKMRSGAPLTDADRGPWLAAVAARIAQSDGAVVVSCSALKKEYRAVLRAATPALCFLLLSAARPVLEARLRNRSGHFMPPLLLQSQLDALQMPNHKLGDERDVLVLDVGAESSVEDTVERAVALLADVFVNL
ncbi:carbohydrate kinase [Obelidium mucronatum]|nr:carbohydrate kinase [Obelidium mucronatum]